MLALIVFTAVRIPVLSTFLVGDQAVCSAELIQPGYKSHTKQLFNLVCNLLNIKQKAILLYLLALEPAPVTRSINFLSKYVNCSASTVWTHLRTLKNLKLIVFSSAEKKGKPLSLTLIGVRVAKYLQDNSAIEKQERLVMKNVL